MSLPARIGFGQLSTAYVDLDRRDNQLRQSQRAVARLAHFYELVFTHAVADMNVVSPFFGHSSFPADLAATRTVVVAHEKSRFRRQLQNALYGLVENSRISAGEIRTCRTAIGHEQRVTNKRGVSYDVRHARWSVSGCRHHERDHVSDAVAIAIFKQSIELASVALKLRPLVEDLAEHRLNDLDVLANAELST